MQLTSTRILIVIIIGIITILIQGIYFWYPWKQTSDTILSLDISPTGVEKSPRSIQTDYTRIINPVDIETRITKDEYSKIQMGMSYKDIADIVGGTGMLLNQTNAWWQVFATYIYYGDDRGANANFTFQDNKLIARTSFGLK